MDRPGCFLYPLLCLLAVLLLGGCPDEGEGSERYSVLEEYGFGLNAKGPAVLPLDWPAALKHPAGAKLTATEEGSIDGAPYQALAFQYDSAAEAAVQHYLSAAQEAGFDHWNCELEPDYCSCRIYNAKQTLLLEFPSRPEGHLALILIKDGDGLILPEQRTGWKGRLPEGFPEHRIPIYPQARTEYAAHDKVGMAELTLLCDADVSKVSSWYRTQLEQLGYKAGDSGEYEGGQGAYAEYAAEADAAYLELNNESGKCRLVLSYKTLEYVNKIGIWD